MFEVSNVDDVAVLHLDGELNFGEIQEIEGILGQLMTSNKTKVVLNFQKVEHVNYKTIQILLEGALKLRTLEGDLKFASMNHYTQDIFKFTGAAQIMESYESVFDAVMSFHHGERHRTWH